MENIIGMDDLEAFVLDFLAYRRELKERRSKVSLPTLVMKEKNFIETTPPTIPFSIGKGWPHYRESATSTPALEPSIPEVHKDIIPTLTPLVIQALSQFGNPTTPKALDHLVCQVIAMAMTIPLVNESITTAEITPWGRVPLLQSVIELLILMNIQRRNE